MATHNFEMQLGLWAGRGVFASEDIPAHSILEVSPVLVLNPYENEEHIRKTNLYNYTYNWPYPIRSTLANDSISTSVQTQAIILGLGSMFNHSALGQNVGWERDIQNEVMTYTTLRDVKAGEELCINYGYRLTFKDADAPIESEYDGSWQSFLGDEFLMLD
ncbi:hypothetical protein EPUL_000160 [Erysiphe pulchra]|uniref:SET domain-containing protein n=1 Tax=Erysiphe pulchra TaxID=225359 RepID=A0A2S4Q2A1_9PEZI|nr:hypothetical protein EPUL_000160 [Erysiphe pulchra]